MANTVLKEYILREMINISDENKLFGYYLSCNKSEKNENKYVSPV